PVLNRVLPKFSATAGALLKTTLAFTMAKGAESSNALPAEAWVVGNMRSSHHQGEKNSVEAIRKIAEKFDIELDIFDPGVESRLTDYKGEAFRLVEEATRAALPNVDEVVPYIMTGASDSRFYDEVSNQCIRFLPFTINEQQLESIHGINENMSIDALIPAVEWYRYMMKKM
ncbi:MAG: M20/M25/M40 family metallo-hydrolase, partial [Mogibacterium sp.]|nr:M20/M25/M40 family metallo-hydrolase [Mogibacterium sp.]